MIEFGLRHRSAQSCKFLATMKKERWPREAFPCRYAGCNFTINTHMLPGPVKTVTHNKAGQHVKRFCCPEWYKSCFLFPTRTSALTLAIPNKYKPAQHPFVLFLCCTVDSLGCSDQIWIYEPILLPGVYLTCSFVFLFRLRSVTQRILVSESSDSIEETPPPHLSFSSFFILLESFSLCPLRSASLTSVRKLLAQLFVI